MAFFGTNKTDNISEKFLFCFCFMKPRMNLQHFEKVGGFQTFEFLENLPKDQVSL